MNATQTQLISDAKWIAETSRKNQQWHNAVIVDNLVAECERLYKVVDKLILEE